MKNSKVLANQKIIRRYQYRSWYLMVILFFILVAVALYFMRTKVISPCQDNCVVKVVMAKETKPELQEIVDYILQVFAPSGRQVQVKALACFISESGLRKDAYNFNTNGTGDYSIPQINSVHIQRFGDGFTKDWKESIRVAYQLYQEQGFKIWYGKYCN